MSFLVGSGLTFAFMNMIYSDDSVLSEKTPNTGSQNEEKGQQEIKDVELMMKKFAESIANEDINKVEKFLLGYKNKTDTFKDSRKILAEGISSSSSEDITLLANAIENGKIEKNIVEWGFSVEDGDRDLIFLVKKDGEWKVAALES